MGGWECEEMAEDMVGLEQKRGEGNLDKDNQNKRLQQEAGFQVPGGELTHCKSPESKLKNTPPVSSQIIVFTNTAFFCL